MIKTTESVYGTTVDILSRTNKRTESPVIVYCHGGAWSYGDRTLIEEAILNQVDNDFVVVSIEYTLGPASVPTALNEITKIIRWVRMNKTELKIDPRKVILSGQSAGAHLSALVGFNSNGFDNPMPKRMSTISSRPNSMILVSGVYDLKNWNVQLPLGPKSKIHFATVLGSKYPQCSAAELSAYSAVSYITTESPRTLLIHGRSDPVAPLSQGIALDDKASAKGVRCKLFKMAGDHALDNSVYQPTVEKFLEYFVDPV